MSDKKILQFPTKKTTSPYLREYTNKDPLVKVRKRLDKLNLLIEEMKKLPQCSKGETNE